MATVVVRRPWTKQPNALPKPSALANSLRVSTLLLPTSAGWADATGNLYRTGGSGTVITVATPDGLARTSSVSAAWSDFLLDRGTLNPADGYAWVMRGTLNSVLGNWGGLIARTADNATGQGWAWQRTSSDVLTVYHNAAAYSNSGTFSQFVDGLEHTFVGVWRKSESKLEFWVDGVLRWSKTGASTAPLYTAGQGQLKILSSRDTPNINGKVAMVAVFNRSLSPGEAQALSLNPWQLFRARQRVLYFDVGGGGTTPITASDTLIPSLTEAQASLVSSSVTETLAPSLTEVAALFKNPEFITVTETLSVSVTEAIALLASSTLTDTLAPSLIESASLNTGAFEVAVTDGLTPSLTEAQTSLVSSAITEALTLTLGEVQGSLLSSSITDTFAISVSEAVTLLVANTVTDTLVVSITDTSGVATADVIAKEVSDALTPYFTELGALEYLDAWQMESRVVGVWTSSSANTGDWTEESSAAGTWSEESPL